MNHDMSSRESDAGDSKTRDGASLRARQQDATRASIIDAFLDLSHDENTVGISMPMVAKRAGVSVRTIYRYFPTKDDLQTAGANFYNDRVSDRLQTEVDASNFDTYLKSLWLDFADELPAVMAEHATPAGRALRTTRLSDTRARLRAAVDPDLDDETVDLIIAVTSSSMFLELVDRMGHSPEAAAAMATRLARLILTHLTHPRTNEATPRTGESS